MANALIRNIYKYGNVSIIQTKLRDFFYRPKSEDLIKTSNFLRNEIMKRVAHRVIQLSDFPFGLNEYKQITNTKNLYIESFDKIHSFRPIESNDNLNEFSLLLEDIRRKHTDVPISISHAIQEFRENNKDMDKQLEIDNTLDKFYFSRIGLRLLIDYHSFMNSSVSVNTSGNTNMNKSVSNTIVDRKCDIKAVINNSAINASQLCYLNYGVSSPRIVINSVNDEPSFPYIQSHLEYISFEIIKNGIYASMKRNGFVSGVGVDVEVPKPITIDILESVSDFIIKFTDYGESVPLSELNSIFSYCYTTAPYIHNPHTYSIPPIAGFGHGLPLSRLYARFFGGELLFIPYHGIKTEVVLYLSKNGDRLETEV